MTEPTEVDVLKAKFLIESGYYQISHKYRTVAALPEGKTGVQALQDARPDRREWAENLGERHAGDFYLRVHAEDKKELTPAVWKAYQALGGGTYMTRKTE